MENHINVHILSEYGMVFNKNSKKHKWDYILNVNKIIKDKLGDTCSIVLNQYQSWVLNYEISKRLKKVISSGKYSDIYYVNSNLSRSSILNIINLLEKKYNECSFSYIMHMKKEDTQDIYNSIVSSDIKIKKAII